MVITIVLPYITLRTLEFSIVRYSKKKKKIEQATFRKLDMFPPLGKGRVSPILLDLLHTANINHWITPSTNHRLHLAKERDPVSESLNLLVFRIHEVERNKNYPRNRFWRYIGVFSLRYERIPHIKK
jgi:hypothetical protein